MASYSRSLTLLVPRCSHTSVSNTLRLYNRHRLIPRRYASQAAAIQSTSEVSAPSFTDLGVSPSLAQALKKTFPNVQIPTKSQRKFIPAVLSGRDVFLQNDTGTGKTFGLILALLSKPREKMSFRKEAGLRGNTRPSTVLLITPHKELALQCMHWVESLHGALGGELSEHAVLVARGSGSTLDEQIRELKTHQPRLVIATPNALLDVLNDDPDALPPWSISTVAVDEVDTLIEHLSANARIYAIKKFERMLKKHPSPTRQILDRIYRISRPSTKDEEEGTSRGEVSSNGFRDSDQFRAQFVATSATLRSYFKNTLRKNTGWVTNRWSSIVDISGTAKGDLASINRLEPAPSDDKGLIQHSALIVHKDGKVVNIDGARVEKAPTLGVEPVGESEADESGLSDSPTEFSDRELEEADSSPFNQHAMEAIATIFALEVPRVALLVLPATAPVQWAIRDLQRLGVNAHGLDILDRVNVRAHLLQKGQQREDNPTMLVATVAFTRGLDMPDLSHVFRLGIYPDRSSSTYAHIAGRVGRFGKPGKVITVVDAPYTVRVGKKTQNHDDVTRVAQIYKKLDITPVHLDYFSTS